MINDITAGISIKLHETFGKDYTIYVEDIPQGFKKPCFLINHVQTLNSRGYSNRYLRNNKFDIIYFPKEGYQKKSDIYSVSQELFLSLEYIFVLDNLARGTKMSTEIVDDALHFFVNYDIIVKKDTGEPEIHMEEINSNIQTEV